MDDFSRAFQNFVGVDLTIIPEDHREHMKERGVVRCRAQSPCWLDGPGTACPCLQRARLWYAFWRVVKLDLEDAYPTLLLPSSGWQHAPFHRPVYTHICICGKREEVYGFRYEYQPIAPDGWFCQTFFCRPIDSIRIYYGNIVVERVVCSQECGNEVARYSQRWDPGMIKKLLEDRHIIKGEDLRQLCQAYGVPGSMGMDPYDAIPDAILRAELEKQLISLGLGEVWLKW